MMLRVEECNIMSCVSVSVCVCSFIRLFFASIIIILHSLFFTWSMHSAAMRMFCGSNPRLVREQGPAQLFEKMITLSGEIYDEEGDDHITYPEDYEGPLKIRDDASVSALCECLSLLLCCAHNSRLHVS